MKKPVISLSPVGFVLLVKSAQENSDIRIQTKVSCETSQMATGIAQTQTPMFTVYRGGKAIYICAREK